MSQSRLKRTRLVATLVFAGACNPVLSSEESLFTSIKSEDCHKPSAAIIGLYEERGLTVEECAAAKDWRLFVASSDERSWIELARDDHVLWSTEEQVVYRNTFGYFPNIGAEKVEWRIAKTKLPTALIFRIAAQNAAAYRQKYKPLVCYRFSRQYAVLLWRGKNQSRGKSAG